MLQSFLIPLYHDIRKIVIDTLFPITCLSCNKESEFLCEDCEKKLTPVEYQICIICKKPSLGGITHPKCFSPYSPDQLISFFDYHDDLVEKLIIRGKYYFIPSIFELLGKIIAKNLKSDYPNLLSPQPSRLPSPLAQASGGQVALSPIPLNKWRLRWRGFNQSEIICQVLSKELNLPFSNVLIRNKITRTQKNLKKEDRIKNMESAFQFSPPQELGRDTGRGRSSNHEIKNQSFILVDDVTTTGSTLIEATKVLKRNHASKVICLTIARD